MATMATIHATADSRWPATGPPIVRTRTALTTAVTGWCLANACSQPGIVATGTKADEANTSGASSGNDAACAVSLSGTERPTIATSHDSEYAKASTSATPATISRGVPVGAQPTITPTTHMSSTTK